MGNIQEGQKRGNQLTTSSITLNSNTSETSAGAKSITSIIKQNKKLKNKSKNLKKHIKALQKAIHLKTQNKINKQIDLECAFSANTINGSNEIKTRNDNSNTPVHELSNNQNMSVQISLKKAISEEDHLIFISRNINRVKATLSKTSSFNTPNYVKEIATNQEHIQDDRDYTDEINR